MRVCLDARCLRNTVTGLGRYAEQLVRALAAIDRTTDYVVILDPRYEGTVVRQDNFTTVRLPGRPDTLGNVLGGARRIGRLKADLYHSLHHFLPFGVPGRTVVTLHDLMLVEHPSITFPRRWQGYAAKAYAQVTIKYALRRADHIIAISQFTAGRAESLFGIPRTGMTVVPHGVEERFFRAGAGEGLDDERWGTALGPAAPRFFLVVGHSKPHKNVARIVGALALVHQRHPDVRLRLVGRGEGYDQLRQQARSLGLSAKVDFLRIVPEAMLLSMYRRAVALVMPSLVEGFGLPVLEAQAAGCPAIVSSRGALAETAGDAALPVDPTDTWDVARAMETLLCDQTARNRLIERGRARAAEFTWVRTASRTREVYDRVMAVSAAGVPAQDGCLSPQSV